MKKTKYKITRLALLARLALLFCIFIVFSLQAFSASQAQAEGSIEKSENAVNYARNFGISVERMEDLLNDAKFSLEKKDFDRVVKIGDEITHLKDLAIALKEKISTAESNIESARKIGYNTSSVEEILISGKEEFSYGNYEMTAVKIDTINSALSSFLTTNLENEIKDIEALSNIARTEGVHLDILDRTIQEAKSSLEMASNLDAAALSQKIEDLNKTISDFLDSKREIQSMTELGFSVERVNDIFKEASISIELGDFKKSQEQSKEILHLKERAVSLNNGLQNAKILIRQLEDDGLDMSSARNDLSLASVKFSQDDYEETEILLSAVNKKAEAAKSASLLFGLIKKTELKFSLSNFLNKYGWIFISSAVLLSIITLIFGKAVKAWILHKEIKEMEKEHETLTGLVKGAQEDYFKKKSISKHTYELIVDKHQSRMLKINETLPSLHSKVAKHQKK